MKREFYIDPLNMTVNFSFDFNKIISGDINNSDMNSRWNPELKLWILPISDWTRHSIKRIIKEYNFSQLPSPSEDDVDFSYKKTEVDIAYLKGLCDANGFTYTPRGYQLEALGFAIEAGNILNGDDVGLGKTFEAILYVETKDMFPCLVIAPASVKDQWKEKWLEIIGNKREVCTINSSPTKKKPNNWDSDVVVINYDIIGKKQGKGATLKFPELKSTKWKSIIFDEAHFLKNKTSIRSKAAKMLTKPDDVIIQMLTGTAIMSRPSEIWNLLVLLKVSHIIAEDWDQFVLRYCDGYRGKYGWVTDGATKTIELNRKLRENFYIRREKRDVLKELPSITKQVIQVPITNLVRLTRAEDDFIGFTREEKGEEAAEAAMEAEQLVMLGQLRKMAIEGKLKAIEQYLKDWKESGVKLLVFGLHREQLDYLAEKFDCKLIAGGTSATSKRQIVLDWQKNDDIFLFGNMASAGTGVDGLQDVCSNMLILELPWRPSDLTQAIGRLERSGQKNATTVTFLLSDLTIDKQMWDMLSNKEITAETVNKGIDIRRQRSGMRDVAWRILNKNK